MSSGMSELPSAVLEPTTGSTCEQEPDPHLTTLLGTPADFVRVWIRSSLKRLGIAARQSLKQSCSR